MKGCTQHTSIPLPNPSGLQAWCITIDKFVVYLRTQKTSAIFDFREQGWILMWWWWIQPKSLNSGQANQDQELTGTWLISLSNSSSDSTAVTQKVKIPRRHNLQNVFVFPFISIQFRHFPRLSQNSRFLSENSIHYLRVRLTFTSLSPCQSSYKYTWLTTRQKNGKSILFLTYSLNLSCELARSACALK